MPSKNWSYWKETIVETMKKWPATSTSLLTFLVVYLFLFDWLLALVISLTVGLLLDFVRDIGVKLPILKILSFSAFVQLVLAPVLMDYYFRGPLPVTNIPIPLMDYLSYAFPAAIALSLSLWAVKPKLNFKEVFIRIEDHLLENPKLPYLLVGVGVSGYLINPWVPTSLLFVDNLMVECLSVAGFYFLFSSNRYKWLWIIVVFGVNLANALYWTVFWHFALWTFLFALFYFVKYPISLTVKVSLAMASILGLFLLQSAKIEYRKSIWKQGFVDDREVLWNTGELGERIEGAKEFLSSGVDPSSSEKGVLSSIAFHMLERLNQGYWDATLMSRVPSELPHLNGETVWKGFVSGLIPRVLWPNKPGSDTNLFKKYTGWNTPHTYMSLSVVGESYLNFGRVGGVLFILFLGMALNMSMHGIVHIASTKVPTIVLWLPLIFFQVVRIETDFTVIFNHLLKSSMFVVMLYTSWRFILRIRL